MEPGKFGPYLRDLRARRGLTQEQVAEALHVSGAAVSKWENGKCLPDLAKLETLAEVLDVSLLDLMRCSTENAPPAARQAMANDPSGPAERTRRQQIRGAAVLLIFTALVIFLQYFPLHRVALVWQPSWFETGEVSLLAYTGSREDRQTAQPVMALAEQAFSTLGLTRAEAAARSTARRIRPLIFSSPSRTSSSNAGMICTRSLYRGMRRAAAWSACPVR